MNRWFFKFTKSDGSEYVSDGGTPPSVPELTALLAGIKPVFFCRADAANKSRWLRLAEFFELKIQWIRPPSWDAREREKFHVLLSKSDGLLKKAAKRTGKEFEQAAYGRVFGYPPCCTAAYLKSLEKPGQEVHVSAHQNSVRSGFHFLLNNLWLLQSRPGHRQEKRRLEKNNAGELPLYSYSAIWWHPCSYRCAASLKIMRSVWKILENLWPEYTRHLKDTLCKPYLYLDSWRFTALEGEADGNKCSYKRLLGPLSLMEPAFYSLLRRGNLVSLKKNEVRVYRNGKFLGSISCQNPLLFPFKSTAYGS